MLSGSSSHVVCCSRNIFYESPHLQCVFQFFNNALMLGKNAGSDTAGRLYDLIYELNSIAPSVLLAVLPQLEFKLKVCFQ